MTHRVRHKDQWPGSGNPRIKLSQASSSGIARILKDWLPYARLLFIHAMESRSRNDHFAAHLEHRRIVATLQSQRYRLHRSRVMGNIFAGGAITACRGPNKNTILVEEAHRNAIELGLTTEDQSA